MSVRFAPTVHGAGDHGFIARIIDADRSHGAAGYVGSGDNRWPAVHRSDAARLVRLGIEHAPEGSVLHAVAEEGVAMRDVAEAISRRFELPAIAISPDEADARFGFLAQFVGLDMPASSALTRDLLGWEPTGPTLVEDIESGAYANGVTGLRPSRDQRARPQAAPAPAASSFLRSSAPAQARGTDGFRGLSRRAWP